MRRLWSIIPQRYRRRTIWVAATIFLRALLNFVGVATLIPILLLILDRNAMASNAHVARLCDTLNIESYEGLVFGVCAAIVAIILVKNLAILLLYRTERNYIYALYEHLSKNLFLSYHNRNMR